MPEPLLLSLRCTDRLVPLGPPDLSTFSQGARIVDPDRDDLVTWLATTRYVPGTCGAHARLRMAGIPASQRANLDLAAFALGLRGILPAPSPRLLAMAAAVPLALSPGIAQSADAETEPEPDEQMEEPTADESGPVVPPPAPEVAPMILDDLSYVGVRLWEAVRGARVTLVIDHGLTVTGTVLAQSSDEIAIARDPDGTVMRVPKDLVMGMRLLATTPAAEVTGPPRIEEPPAGGRTIAAVGGVLTGLGATMLSTFAIGSAIDSSFPYYGFPLMLIGPALLAPGIPLLAAGLLREERRHDWRVEQELQITTGPTRGGWSGALSISF